MSEIILEFTTNLERRKLSRATIRGYKYDLLYFDSFLRDMHGAAVQLKKIGESDLKGYRSELIEKKKLKPASVNRKVVILRKFFEWAVQERLIKSNPAPDLRLIRIRTEKRTEFLQPGEVRAVLRSAGLSSHGMNRRNYAIIKLILEAGLRVQEIIDLKVSDVAIYDRSGFLSRQLPGREEPASRMLSRELRTALADYLAARKTMDSSDRLFTSTHKRALSPRGVLKMIRTVADRAKIPGRKVTAEIMRNTFIINELKSDPDNASDLAEFLGYTSTAPLAPYVKLITTEGR